MGADATFHAVDFESSVICQMKADSKICSIAAKAASSVIPDITHSEIRLTSGSEILTDTNSAYMMQPMAICRDGEGGHCPTWSPDERCFQYGLSR